MPEENPFEEEKEGKKKVDKDTLEIKIRFSKFWLERMVYVIIILILITLLIYNPLGRYRCEKGLSELTSEAVTNAKKEDKAEEEKGAKQLAGEKDKGEGEDEPEIEEEAGEEAVEEEKESLKIEEENGTEVEKEGEASESSGKATLEIGEIKLGSNNTKVESITITVDNQKKIFTPLLYVYWYDETTEEAVKANPKGGKINLTGPVPVGAVKQIKLDSELKAHLLSNYDTSKEIFKVELYDRSDPEIALDTKTKTMDTD